MLIRNRMPDACGWIEVICGGMFSGKTEELLRRIRRAHFAKQRVQIFKPELDDRFSLKHIQSHNANRLPSLTVKNAREILAHLHDKTQIVGIDEAQFFDAEIVSVAQKLANRGLQVIVAGLDMDYQGEPFGSMPQMLAIAESVTKLLAVCVICGNSASRTQRISPSDGTQKGRQQILVGAKEDYEARCRFCHIPEALEGVDLPKKLQQA